MTNYQMTNNKIKEKKYDLEERTARFGEAIIKFTKRIPVNEVSKPIIGQLVRAGTSVGANYRAATRARSTADFISKMGIVEEESDESMYWMELIVEGGLLKKNEVDSLYKEADEILAMVVASIKTAKKRKK